jgi:DNA-binding NarL/FixJ family response regulator
MTGPRTRVADARSEPTRVLIADDSERIRRGLHGLFELVDDIEVVAEAVNGAHAVELAAELHPDVVLMDVGMPVMDGIEATRLIRATRPGIRVLILTALAGQCDAARTAGSDAFVLKDADPDEILETVRSLSEAVPLRP